jgi:16S rRNA (guanine(966)-N(2))-methyltransferase RsmD
VRIVSGILKGTVIQPPKGLPVRPTTDRAKESLFNILENRIDFNKLKVLDLFSGTGNITYEFYSRGVQQITAVDIHHGCTAFIKSMAAKYQMHSVDVVKKNVYQFVKQCNLSYDLIFADAPYAQKELHTLPALIMNNPILSPGGLLIIEHESRLSFEQEIGFENVRVYGQSAFSFFTKAIA